MRAIKSPKLRAKLDEIEKNVRLKEKTNQLLSEIDENTENWARRRNTINKVRLDLNEFEKLDPFLFSEVKRQKD